MIIKKILILLLKSSLLIMLTVSIANAQGNWVLDKRNSHVSFFTLKKGSVGESFDFFDFSGTVRENNASVKIQTDSLDTQVAIRNDRLKKYLFKVDEHPVIEVSADVSEVFKRLKNRSVIDVELPASLTLNGVTAPIFLRANVAKRNKSNLIVSSIQPVIIKAENFQLSNGLAMLSKLAGNITIGSAVPVSFVLHFKRN